MRALQPQRRIGRLLRPDESKHPHGHDRHANSAVESRAKSCVATGLRSVNASLVADSVEEVAAVVSRVAVHVAGTSH